MNPLLSFTNPLWQFQICSGIYWHNIAGINGPKVSFTESLLVFNDQQWQPLIRDVLCQSTGDNYCSPMSLPIGGVIYQSAAVNYWSAKRRKKLQIQTKKKSQAKKNYFACLLWYNGPTFCEKKKLPLHKSLSCYFFK